MKNIFIKILALAVLIIGFLLALAGLGAALYIWIYYKDAVFLRKILFEIVVLIFAFFSSAASLGIYQFLNRFIEMEEEVEELEEKKEGKKEGEDI